MAFSAPAAPLVALTIWTALALYAAGEYGRTRRPAAAWARRVWLLGALVYLAHVGAAFGTHHDWSHAAAYAYTAARTAALIGLDWGGGLWVNYAFTAIWVGEGLWWQLRPTHYARRSAVWTPAVRGVFLFMIANGAVIFVEGPRRALGLGVLAALVWIWRTGAQPRERDQRDQRDASLRTANGLRRQVRRKKRCPPATGRCADTPRLRGAP